VLIALALSGSAFAKHKRDKPIDDTPRDQLQRVEKDIASTDAKRQALEAEADKLAAEIAALDAQLLNAAAAVQAGEDALTGLERRQADIEARERSAEAELDRRRGDMTALLAALERLAHRPPEALLASPGTPVDSLRSAMLLGAVLPQIDQQATALKQSLLALAALKQELGESRKAVAVGGQRLTAERSGLDRLMQEKAARQAAARAGAAAEGKRVAALGEKAADLKGLIQRLDEEAKRRAEAEAAREKAEKADEAKRAGEQQARVTAEAAQQAVEARAAARKLAQIRQALPMSQAEGNLTLPVSGSLGARFEDAGQFGAKLRGITLRTRAGAVVIAPQGGQVAFAGPFRGYGMLLIISTGEGYHFLLAGLGRIDVSVGQYLLAGEPVGQLGPDGFQRDGGPAGGAPELYVELRHRGEPIDPWPWFAPHDVARSGKASG